MSEADKWEKIETAPKDGTAFIAYQSVNSDMQVISSCIFDCGEFVFVNFGEGRHTAANPTHWIPLPQPPKGEE